jgi:hypothetical protein
MRSYNLNIAGYVIRFESASGGLQLTPSRKFREFFSPGSSCDVLIRVHSEPARIPESAVRVFHAPAMEEVNGRLQRKSDNFWSVWKSGTNLFIRTFFPLSSHEKTAILRFSTEAREWDLWIDHTGEETDPLEYPLDGLVLYYLTVIHGDIMIHASGISFSEQGYLFSGVSGKGKSTMARLWENSGAKVIHDDRLIVKKTGKGYTMFNTPVYDHDSPCDSQINHIFLIEHGPENMILPVRESAAVSLVMANCIQHGWDAEVISRLLASVSELCTAIPVARLSFRPDNSIIDTILVSENEGKD